MEPATIPQDMRRGMIAEAAYLRAERRGFAPGGEDEDWLAAEAEVDPSAERLGYRASAASSAGSLLLEAPAIEGFRRFVRRLQPFV